MNSSNGWPIHTSEKSVLIIDDEETIVDSLKDILSRQGYKVVTANTGQKGVDLACENHPNVILLDLGLPDMDGQEVIEQIRASYGQEYVPIIVITGRIGSHDVVRAFEAGANDYLRKPLDYHSLTTRIRFMCDIFEPRQQADTTISYLQDEITRKTEHIRLLYGLTHDFNSSESLEDVLERLVEALQLTAQANRISVYLKTEESLLEFKAGLGLPQEMEKYILIPENWGIASSVFRKAQAASNESLLNEFILQPDRYDGHVFYCVPILLRKKHLQTETLGVVNITERKEDRPFTLEELECIQSIISAAAVAIQNQLALTQQAHSIGILLRTIGRLAEYRDEETASHLERVPQISRMIAEELGQSEQYSNIINAEFIQNLVQAAPLHDIGKIGIPDAILTKQGPLTAREMQIMRTHTTIGKQILELAVDHSGMTSLLKMCIDISYCHHERWDGAGYPRKIGGTTIPLASRILAVADAYDAITSRRCYKVASPHEAAVQIIQNDSGSHFDPDVADAFFRVKDSIQEYCQNVVRDYTSHYAEV